MNDEQKNTDVITISTITCPVCGFSKEEHMMINACQYIYECSNCRTLLNPKKGDCCVFCSDGSVTCPPIQLKNYCCS